MMQVCYFALVPIKVKDRIAQPGDLIPEAVTWPFVTGYVNEGRIAPVLVSTLSKEDLKIVSDYEAEQAKELEEYNKARAEEAEKLANAPDQNQPTMTAADPSSSALMSNLSAAITAEAAKEAPAEEEAEEGEAAAEDEEETYDAWTVDELKAELDTRNIGYTSADRKADLIAKLEEDDAAGEATASPEA